MYHLQRISGAVWGPPLLQMRQLYLAQIRPIVSYGCAVWYLRGQDVRWGFSSALLAELESRQYQCLVQIAGSFKQISRECLRKELHIEPLELLLERQSSAFRARALEWDFQQVRPPQSQKARPVSRQQPHVALERRAKQLLAMAWEYFEERKGTAIDRWIRAPKTTWKSPKDRAKAINGWACIVSEVQCSQWWGGYRDERQFSRVNNQPVLWNDWGVGNLAYYRDLPRPQSTLLLQCRTGVGGFGTHLFRFKVRRPDRGVCFID